MVLFKLLQGNERSHTFPKGISLKVNVIALLGFELAYYDVAAKHISLGVFPPI